MAAKREPAWLHSTARTVVETERQLFLESGALEITEDGVHWWTYAGGKINSTLRYAVRACEPEWKVVPDNYSLKIMGEGVSLRAMDTLITRLSDPEFWANERLWQEIAEDLPNYRLSKFQDFMPPWVVREMVAGFLLDIEGAWRFLGGCSSVEMPQTPTQLRDLPQSAVVQTRAPPSDGARPKNPIHWVAERSELVRLCALLAQESRIGLDVETTLRDRRLCLIQVANATDTWLIDPLQIDDLSAFAALMVDPGVVKIIHNATFEKSVLKQHDMRITPVLDTLKRSREVRGRKIPGRHSLAAVTVRELGETMSKEEQTSDWRRRPLSTSQVQYAALDAEILLRVADALGDGPQGDLFA